MNFDIAHENMIKQQIRPLGIPCSNVVQAMIDIPRQDFIDEKQKAFAYSDSTLIADSDETLLSSETIAKALNILNIDKYDYVLEICTQSGYVTALLSQLAKIVETNDIDQNRLTTTKQKLKNLNITNVKFENNDLLLKPNDNKYDIIFINSIIDAIPNHIFEMAKPNGKIFAIMNDSVAYRLFCYYRLSGKWISENFADNYKANDCNQSLFKF